MKLQRITPCFWFNDQAEEAVAFYTAVFPDSSVQRVVRHTDDGPQGKQGDVMTIDFALGGQQFTALNGGPLFQFNEAVSMVVHCQTQDEVDHFWLQLGEGGDPEAQQCGWLKDRYGLSWQIVPHELPALLSDPDPARARRATEAMMQMKKLDIVALRAAANGAVPL